MSALLLSKTWNVERIRNSLDYVVTVACNRLYSSKENYSQRHQALEYSSNGHGEPDGLYR
jgi:hypothetical protein